jgi:hypothetical protein
MRIVIVHKTVRRSGRVSTREEVQDLDRLTIGRGTDNDIQLSGLAIEIHHSVVTQRADGVYLECAESAELEVNKKRCRERLLRPKDRIRVGGFQLTVLPNEGDEDLRVELEAVTRRRSEMEELRSRTFDQLSGGLLTERKLSWLAVLLIPGIFFLVPMVIRSTAATTTAGSGPGVSWLPNAVLDVVRGLERFWDTGEVAHPHALIGNECYRCHAQPFTPVRDQECLTCHADIRDHTPPGMEVAQLDRTRCATCHMEHNGELELERLEQQLCADCHSDLVRYAPQTAARQVTDFGANHAQFRLTVPTDAVEPLEKGGAPVEGSRGRFVRTLRRLEWSRTLEERSGVKFNHVRHVGREEVVGEKGKVLDCGGCHQMDDAGKNMRPILFETHCQSCHSISFEETSDRQAIHGDAVAMRVGILEFYKAAELDKAERQGVFRQRVGAEFERAQDIALATARAKLERANRFLMNTDDPPGACANCHFVERGAALDGGDDVAEVRLLNLWMPMSNFRHQAHSTYPCRSCHPAAAVYDPAARASYESDRDVVETQRPRPEWSILPSGLIRDDEGPPYVLYTPEELRAEHGLEPSDEALDVLVPGIERCQTCHAGGRAKNSLVASECVLCHPFHRKEYDRMRPQGSAPAAAASQEPLWWMAGQPLWPGSASAELGGG